MVFQCPKAHCHAPAAVQVLRRVSPHGPHADRGSRDGWFNKPIIFVGIDGGYDGYIYIYIYIYITMILGVYENGGYAQYMATLIEQTDDGNTIIH